MKLDEHDIKDLIKHLEKKRDIKRYTKDYDITEFIKDRCRESTTMLLRKPIILICSDNKDFGGIKFDKLENAKIIDQAERLNSDYIYSIINTEKRMEDYRPNPISIICKSIQEFPDEFCFTDHKCDERFDNEAYVIIFIIKGNILIAKDNIHPSYPMISNKISLKKALEDLDKVTEQCQ